MAFRRVIAGLLMVAMATAEECSRANVDAGLSIIPHDTYLELFLNCNSNLEATEMMCPTSTLFHKDLTTCYYSTQLSNPACDCKSGLVSTCPSVCGDAYFRCSTSGDSVVRVQCNINEKYDQQVNGCVQMPFGQAVVDYKDFCSRNVGTTPFVPIDPNTPCLQRPGVHLTTASDGNVCHFDHADGPEVRIPNRPCGEQMEFSPTVCTCVKSFNPQCSRTISASNVACDVTAGVDFLNNQPNTFKETNGVRTPMQLGLQVGGVTYQNNAAVFRPDTLGTPPFMYLHFFVANELRQPFVFAVTFQVTNNNNQGLFQPAQQFTLIRNERTGSCVGESTLTVTVTPSQGQLSVRVDVTGYSETDAVFSDSMSNTITDNGFVKLTLTMDSSNRMSGRLVNSFGEDKTLGPSNGIGVKLKSKCGFEIGNGLSGEIKDITYYSICNDFSRINYSP